MTRRRQDWPLLGCVIIYFVVAVLCMLAEMMPR